MSEKLIKNKYIVLLLVVGAVYFFLKYICPLVDPILIAILFLTTPYQKTISGCDFYQLFWRGYCLSGVDYYNGIYAVYSGFSG